jgi:hypothetical protein
VWSVGPLYLSEGGIVTMDLALTLPDSVVKGGIFSVASEGAALPAGMMLSSQGVLAIGTAAPGPVVGVVFTYTEPAG